MALKARLAKLRATGATLSKLPFDEAAQLRNALRRSRRQKTAIKSLSRENARLRKAAKTSRGRIDALEAQLARLRATGAVLSKALFGRKRSYEAAGRPALQCRLWNPYQETGNAHGEQPHGAGRC